MSAKQTIINQFQKFVFTSKKCRCFILLC